MTVKYIDTYSKNWPVAAAGVLSFGYLIFILPIHIGWAGFNFAYRDIIFNGLRQKDIPLTLFLWGSLAVTLALTIYSIRKQRSNIKAFTSFFRESELCAPSPQNIAMNRTGWGYLGLDTRKGTLLYINHPDTTIFNFFFPRDVRVMGFGMYDWKSIEVEGNKLTIYTGNPELPTVAITTSKAGEMLEKINAMRNQNWSYEYNIPGCVELQAQNIAERNGINLVLPPK
ncbi:plasmid IncI1-type surface exclusion protein ExcA [Scandinavium goeteborgense]|uniref:plasmid IncI1-type surface exclusion protein ExcA n=1 Tax=Scandinavium goeteborgense TaxID=1851514 RepID=UPI002166A681|nr:plasmid IncI1-type surface exclusion protein ExcA [Scandinavium goeteborgense]MCS2151264.1 plasmid IncI1-type surface exclusion protein ExcA [Scandinavium goeteborgense]